MAATGTKQVGCVDCGGTCQSECRYVRNGHKAIPGHAATIRQRLESIYVLSEHWTVAQLQTAIHSLYLRNECELKLGREL